MISYGVKVNHDLHKEKQEKLNDNKRKRVANSTEHKHKIQVSAKEWRLAHL